MNTRLLWSVLLVCACAGFAPMVEAASLAAAEAPLLRRFLIAQFGLLSGFGLSISGWNQFDLRKRWLGAGLVAGGLAVALGGLLLLRLSGYQSTWDWWL